MSFTGAKRNKVLTETEVIEPAILHKNEKDWKEWQARRLRLLWKLRGIPLRAFVVCSVLSIIVPFLIPNSYVATTQLMPPDSNSSSSMAVIASLAAKAGPFAGMAGDLLNVKTPAGLFIGVLTSQNLESQLVHQFNLRKVYKVKNDEEAREKLNEDTYVREDKNSGLIAISVMDRSPQLAATIANAYVDQLNSLVAELSTSSARRERLFLEERLKLVQQDLDSSTNQLARFSSNTRMLNPDQEGKAMLDAQVNLTAQLVAAEAQLEGLRHLYTDRHPRVAALNAKIGELRRQIQKLGGSSEELPPSGLTEQSTQTNAKNQDQDYPSIRTLPLLGAKYVDYYRHVKTQEAVYELLTSQYELAKVQEAKELPTIKILDFAQPPLKKSAPHRLLLISLGMFLSFGAATLVWFAVMFWHDIDPMDPRFLVVNDAVEHVKAQLPWNSNAASEAFRESENIGTTPRSMRDRHRDDGGD